MPASKLDLPLTTRDIVTTDSPNSLRTTTWYVPLSATWALRTVRHEWCGWPTSARSSVWNRSLVSIRTPSRYHVIYAHAWDYYAAVLIGSITRSARPSVRLSVTHGLLSRKQTRVEIGKPKLAWSFPNAEVNCATFFGSEGQRSKVKGQRSKVKVRAAQCSGRERMHSYRRTVAYDIGTGLANFFARHFNSVSTRSTATAITIYM